MRGPPIFHRSFSPPFPTWTMMRWSEGSRRVPCPNIVSRCMGVAGEVGAVRGGKRCNGGTGDPRRQTAKLPSPTFSKYCFIHVQACTVDESLQCAQQRAMFRPRPVFP